MGLTFSIAFNQRAQRYISTGQTNPDNAVHDLLREAFYGAYAVFNPVSEFQRLENSKKYTRFEVTLNDKLSERILGEARKPEDALDEVIGGYLRKTCKVWDQEGYKFTAPVLC